MNKNKYTEGTRRYLSVGAATGLLGQMVAIGGGILAQVVIARNLTTSDFGIYSLAATLTFLGAIILRCGLHAHSVQHLAQLTSPIEVSREARKIATISIIVAGLALPILGLICLPVLNQIFLEGRLAPAVQWIVAITISLEAMRYVFSETFRGMYQQVSANILGNAGRTLIVVILIGAAIAVSGSFNLTDILFFMLASTALTAAVGGVALWVRTIRVSSLRSDLPNHHYFLGALSRGSPFLVTELSAFGLAWGDILVVGLVGTHDDVAVYAVASRVAAMLAVPVYVMTGVLNPIISTTWSRGETEKLQRILRSCLAAVVAPMACALVVVVLYGGEFLKLVFGPEYSRGSLFLIILAIAAASNVIFGMGFQVLMMCGQARIATAITVTFSCGTLLSEFLAAKLWGVQGVALASTGGSLLTLITVAIVCRYSTGVRAYPGVFELCATFREMLSNRKSSHHRGPDPHHIKDPGDPRER